jgi:hypothetical protein
MGESLFRYKNNTLPQIVTVPRIKFRQKTSVI